MRQYIVTPSALLPVVMVAGGTFGGLLFDDLVKLLLGQLNVGFGEVVRIALLAALYNAILTPLCYPILRRLAEASRAKRVYRW
jgi:hypothetical protein